MTKEPNQVEIHQARTDIVITEAVGTLNKEDVQKVISLVLQHIRDERDVSAQREKDTAITNRVYPPAVR